MYYAKENIKYFGSFSYNRKNGYGICIFCETNNRYYGGWYHDKYHDYGTYIHRDGTIFHGKWFKGKKSGKGFLYLPNGDMLEGSWKGEKIEQGTYRKGNCKQISLTTLKLVQGEITEAMRKREGFSDETNVNKHKWVQYFELQKPLWTKEQEEMKKTLKSLQPFTTYEKVAEFVNSLLTNKLGFTSKFIDFVISAFQGSYSSGATTNVKTKQSEIPSAIDDIKSFILFLQDLFVPFLGESKLVDSHFLKPIMERMNLLFSDHIHTRVYQTLFPLYSATVRNVMHGSVLCLDFKIIIYIFAWFFLQQYEENDLMINQKLKSLRQCSIQSLGVPEQFCPIVDPNSKEIAYNNSVNILERMRSKKTPAEKIDVLREVRSTIMREVRATRKQRRKQRAVDKGQEYTDEMEHEDEAWQPGIEDVIGVYTYVFIHAQIDNHHAQFHFINDWKGKEIVLDSVYHTITFYEGFPSLVLDLGMLLLAICTIVIHSCYFLVLKRS